MCIFKSKYLAYTLYIVRILSMVLQKNFILDCVYKWENTVAFKNLILNLYVTSLFIFFLSIHEIF